MNIIDVSVTEVEPPHWLPRLEHFGHRVLEKLRLDNWELSIVICGDAFIRDLNNRFRGKDESTDVLSFEQGAEIEALLPESGMHIAGDIVISLDTVFRNSEVFSVLPAEEVKRLVIHGILHLQGFDHSDNSPEQEMLKIQEEILGSLSEEELF